MLQDRTLSSQDRTLSSQPVSACKHCSPPPPQAIMLAVMKKLKYDEEYNFENEVSGGAALCWPCGERRRGVTRVVCVRAKTKPCLWSTGSS